MLLFTWHTEKVALEGHYSFEVHSTSRTQMKFQSSLIFLALQFLISCLFIPINKKWNYPISHNNTKQWKAFRVYTGKGKMITFACSDRELWITNQYKKHLAQMMKYVTSYGIRTKNDKTEQTLTPMERPKSPADICICKTTPHWKRRQWNISILLASI